MRGGGGDRLGLNDVERAIVVGVIQNDTRLISLIDRRTCAHEFQSWQVIETRKRPVQKCPLFSWHVASDENRISGGASARMMQRGKQIVGDLIDLECTKEPLPYSEGEEPWTRIGEREGNLTRRYSFVRPGLPPAQRPAARVSSSETPG